MLEADLEHEHPYLHAAAFARYQDPGDVYLVDVLITRCVAIALADPHNGTFPIDPSLEAPVMLHANATGPRREASLQVRDVIGSQRAGERRSDCQVGMQASCRGEREVRAA